MGIRVQPREIEIPEDNPFEYDLLARKEKIEVLTRLVGNIDGPCAMAVDAAWGAGKTTFLKMWAQHLRNEGFPVVEFNAWETDFTGEPFVALSSEITEELRGWEDQAVKQKIQDMVKRLVDKGKDVLRLAVSLGIRSAAATQPEIDPATANAVASVAENWFTDYPEARKSVREFKDELEDLAEELWHACSGKPLVVFIDELDRCRPSYAIELLETGKHIFGVNHIVFVLAVNRAELAKSVKVLYGDEFNAEGYLQRFFDVDFVLPAPDRDPYIDGLLENTGIIQYLSSERRQYNEGGQLVRGVLKSFLGQSDLSLRNIGQSLHRLGLIISSLSEKEHAYAGALAVMTVIDAVDPRLYRRFAQGALTDQDLVDALRTKYPDGLMDQHPFGYFLQSLIIASRISEDSLLLRHSNLQATFPLLWKYINIERNTDSATTGTDRTQALTIMQMIRGVHRSGLADGTREGFHSARQRFDLLSTDFLADDLSSRLVST